MPHDHVDPIMAELHQAKDEIARDCAYDVAALAMSSRAEQKVSKTSETEQGDRVTVRQAHQVSPQD